MHFSVFICNPNNGLMRMGEIKRKGLQRGERRRKKSTCLQEPKQYKNGYFRDLEIYFREPFYFQNCLNFNNPLETFLRDYTIIDMIASDRCSRFVSCSSMMRLPCSTTSQRSCSGLRSGDCGGRLSHCRVEQTSLR